MHRSFAWWFSAALEHAGLRMTNPKQKSRSESKSGAADRSVRPMRSSPRYDRGTFSRCEGGPFFRGFCERVGYCAGEIISSHGCRQVSCMGKESKSRGVRSRDAHPCKNTQGWGTLCRTVQAEVMKSGPLAYIQDHIFLGRGQVPVPRNQKHALLIECTLFDRHAARESPASGGFAAASSHIKECLAKAVSACHWEGSCMR
jgi:hypothetical protein